MFIKDGSFIISFNASKEYISVTIEKQLLDELKEEITQSGYEVLSMVFHINYTDQIDFDLLKKVINRVVEVKKNSKGFWL